MSAPVPPRIGIVLVVILVVVIIAQGLSTDPGGGASAAPKTPPIFASSILLFPAQLAGFTQSSFLQRVADALQPGDFVLAETLEMFHLPEDVAALFVLKSSMARAGLEHSQAGFADPHWHGSVLTLELKNITAHHTLLLKPGMRIGQMVFFRVAPVPESKGYGVKGAYNRAGSVVATRNEVAA